MEQGNSITTLYKEINMDIPRKLILSLAILLPLCCFAGEVVDINTADTDTLMTVKGIGEKRAAAIIAYRDSHGQFKSVDDLAQVRGISENLIEKARASLKVSREK